MTDSSSNADSSSLVADSQDQRVPLRTKFFFGVGTIGETASNWIFLSLAFFYYERIIGLSAALAGIAAAGRVALEKEEQAGPVASGSGVRS